MQFLGTCSNRATQYGHICSKASSVATSSERAQMLSSPSIGEALLEAAIATDLSARCNPPFACGKGVSWFDDDPKALILPSWCTALVPVLAASLSMASITASRTPCELVYTTAVRLVRRFTSQTHTGYFLSQSLSP